MDTAPSCRTPGTPVREHWPLILPLAALVYLLFAGYTPIFAGTMGLALTIVLILGMPLAALIGPLRLPPGLLDRARARRRRLPALRRQHPRAGHRRAGRSPAPLFNGGRETLRHLRRLAGRGREERAAGRHRLRHRRHRHRHADADRHRLDLHRRDHRHRQGQPLPVAGPDHAHLPGARHGHPDDPELHHHLLARRPGAARARRAAARQPHVRLLLRHHGRPDAAGGARRLRRRADGQGLGHEDRAAGDQARGRRLRRAVHGGLHAGADAAGRRRRSPRASAIRSRSPTSSLKACLGIGLWGAAVVGFLVGADARSGSASSPSPPACSWSWRLPLDRRGRLRARGRR